MIIKYRVSHFNLTLRNCGFSKKVLGQIKKAQLYAISVVYEMMVSKKNSEDSENILHEVSITDEKKTYATKHTRRCMFLKMAGKISDVTELISHWVSQISTHPVFMLIPPF